MMLAALIGLIVVLVPLPHRRPRPRPSDDGGVLSLLELTALGISGGLSFREAARAAAVALGGAVGAATERRLRGIGGDDHDLERAFAMAEWSAESGAPLLAGLDGFVAELRAAEDAARLERIRRLPVLLLFPLALLVLPGFLLLTVGPVVAGSLQRLGL